MASQAAALHFSVSTLEYHGLCERKEVVTHADCWAPSFVCGWDVCAGGGVVERERETEGWFGGPLHPWRVSYISNCTLWPNEKKWEEPCWVPAVAAGALWSITFYDDTLFSFLQPPHSCCVSQQNTLLQLRKSRIRTLGALTSTSIRKEIYTHSCFYRLGLSLSDLHLSKGSLKKYVHNNGTCLLRTSCLRCFALRDCIYSVCVPSWEVVILPQVFMNSSRQRGAREIVVELTMALYGLF